MTDPLIDRSELRNRLRDWIDPPYAEGAADVAMAYLREVLTPEALDPAEVFVDYDGCNSIRILKGSDLHRRIFGEDR